MIRPSIRWTLAIAAFVWLVCGYMVQQWYYFRGRLSEFDRLVQQPNIWVGWFLLICAMLLALFRDKEPKQT